MLGKATCSGDTSFGSTKALSVRTVHLLTLPCAVRCILIINLSVNLSRTRSDLPKWVPILLCAMPVELLLFIAILKGPLWLATDSVLCELGFFPIQALLMEAALLPRPCICQALTLLPFVNLLSIVAALALGCVCRRSLGLIACRHAYAYDCLCSQYSQHHKNGAVHSWCRT